ncbi:hypothetical protein D5086_004909 [Populus alba]|uniref:Uncharacterized protein n=1 Tax=Populus alba TaxID=43335 RepID=A0ACC4CRV0_POPAL
MLILACCLNPRVTIYHFSILQGNIFRYVSSSLIEEPCKSSYLAALDVANKKAGCLLCYDPNLRLPPWPSEEAAERNREHME